MKKIALLMLALMMALSLTACGQSPKAASTADTPLNVLVDNVIAKDGLFHMPKTDLEDVIGIDPADFKEAVFLQDDGMGGREVLALRAADKNAAARVAAQLEKYLAQRQKETRNYLPDAYKLLESARVQTKNLTVVLISGENAANWTTKLLAGE